MSTDQLEGQNSPEMESQTDVNVEGNSEDSADNSETPAAPEKPKFDISTLDDTDQLLFAKAEKQILEYNAMEKERRALSGDLAEVSTSVLEGDDVDVIALVEAVNKAKATLETRQAKLDETVKEKAEALIAANTDTEKVKELETKSQALLKRIKGTVTLLQNEGDVKSAFTPILSNKAVGSGTGKGEGIPRPRNFTVAVDSGDGKGPIVAKAKNNKNELVSSFSAAAKVTGVDTKVLQDGYFATEGTDANNWKVGKAVTYNVVNGDKTYVVTATKNPDPVSK